MEEAAWAAAIATFLAVLLALFKEDIVYYLFWWHHPCLVVRTRRGAPDWAKTPLFGIYPEQLPSGEQVHRWGPVADAYYFRIWVENTGRERAEDVQVYAAKLWKRQADGTFQPVNTFLPMNLRWAHSPDPAEPEIFDDMNPKRPGLRLPSPTSASLHGRKAVLPQNSGATIHGADFCPILKSAHSRPF